MGTAVVFGMATATLLSVFFIPVLYYAVETLQDKLEEASGNASPRSNRPNPARAAAREGGTHETFGASPDRLAAPEQLLLAPTYERAPGEVPPEYRFQSPEGQPQPELASLADLSWWEMFDDPVLQGLIRTALRNNYDVRLAVARVAEARAGVGVSRSFWLPQVGGTALFQREKLSRTSVNPPVPPGVNVVDSLAQFNFDLFWEIDLFGRLRNLTRPPGLNSLPPNGARGPCGPPWWPTWPGPTSSFAPWTGSWRLPGPPWNPSRNPAAWSCCATTGAWCPGRTWPRRTPWCIPPEARSLTWNARSARRKTRSVFCLGTNPQPIQRGKSLRELVVRPQVPAGLPSALLERRPDIRQSEAVLIATNYRIGAARANFFPRITLTGLAGTQSVDLGRLFSGPSSIWNIGPTLTLPIFTSGYNYFTLQATHAQQEQALVLYQFTVRQAFREVSDGLVAHTKFQEFRQEQEALVQSYQAYSKTATKRYKGGLESFLSVLDADRQLFTAELDLAAVQRDQLLTLVQLYKALGGGWEPLRQPPDPAVPTPDSAEKR